MINNYLEIKKTYSNHKDTLGWTIVTLIDINRKKRYKTCGGGYSLLGDVMGDWMQATFHKQLFAIMRQAQKDSKLTEATNRGRRMHTDLYGLFGHWKGDELTGISIDGACGDSSMERIMDALGILFKRVYMHGSLVGFEIKEPDAPLVDAPTT